MRLLVTRPEPDGERTAATLRASGHDVLLAPMLRVRALPGIELGAGPWSGVVMTSANAARAVAGHAHRAWLLGLPVFAVGSHTADAVREAGFSNVHSADGDGGDLVRLVVNHAGSDGRPLLYLAGEDRARDVAGDLRQAGWDVQVAVVYRTEPAGVLPAAVNAALLAGSIDGVLHYSRRSAEAYLAGAKAGQLGEAALRPVQYCLSEQVAEPLAKAAKVRIAQRPSEDALLALLHPD